MVLRATRLIVFCQDLINPHPATQYRHLPMYRVRNRQIGALLSSDLEGLICIATSFRGFLCSYPDLHISLMKIGWEPIESTWFAAKAPILCVV